VGKEWEKAWESGVLVVRKGLVDQEVGVGKFLGEEEGNFEGVWRAWFFQSVPKKTTQMG
jgi:hypothetical protein